MTLEQVNLISICLYGRGTLKNSIFTLRMSSRYQEYLKYLCDFLNGSLSKRDNSFIVKVKHIDFDPIVPKDYLLHLSCQCGINNRKLRYFKIKTNLNLNGFIYIGSREYFNFLEEMRSQNIWKCFDYKFENRASHPKINFGSGKLDRYKASEIRSLYWEKNLKQEEIAKIYNVSRVTVTNIINNKIYKTKSLTGNSIVKMRYSYGNKK